MKKILLSFFVLASALFLIFFTSSCGGCTESINFNKAVSDTTAFVNQELEISTKNLFIGSFSCDGGDGQFQVKVSDALSIDTEIALVKILSDSTAGITGLKKGSTKIVLFASQGVVDATHFNLEVK